MPKMKTHSGTAKRVKRTASGKLKVSHASRSHLKGNKNNNTIRNNRSASFVSKSDVKRIKHQISNVK
ncbi:MAG: 50S ribosomal protein L35 [Candidatus Izemoplasmataceae bacterium]|jgi:large subunit ribosomal protein L35|uniref:50S ribosomal protein L35 n=1 Tax=Liberiplasma polymorphum TaxID=3374570 RepID=UPI003776900A